MHNIKTILKKVLNLGPSPKDAFLSYHYQRHNQRRLEHLSSLGLKIAGSTVLEVGAGIGDHTSFFVDRGCKVVTSDGRQQNIEILRSRYPDVRALHIDLDSPPGEFNEVFDIVYCYGLLYHLKNPTRAIEFMSSCCRNMLLLETCVSFGDEALLNPNAEDRLDPTQSYTGIGSRPTRRWVCNQLKRHFQFVYLPITQPNHEEFPIDWTPTAAKKGLARAVFIASRQKIVDEIFQEEIPTKQIRH